MTGKAEAAMSVDEVVLGERLDARSVVAVARQGSRVRLSAEAGQRMTASARFVDEAVTSDATIYGITTGFGALANTRIPADRIGDLQTALVRSHAAGMGSAIESDTVRALMLLRARSLAMGYSGVRPEIVELQIEMLNCGLTPVVPEYGSLGASGDLAPLSHCALAMMGEGLVRDSRGAAVDAAEALSSHGLAPVQLRAKEGLALINGTDGMLAMLILCLNDLDRLGAVADLTAAMTTEAALGTDRAFSDELIGLRPHPGQMVSAENLTRLMRGSAIVASHKHGDGRVQDAYSLRCTPQVHGAARDTITHSQAVAERELASVVDNPVVLPDGRVESCGNFHGAPLALAADFLAIAVSELSAVSERRTDRLLDVTRNEGLPAFLAQNPGVNSGYMIAHYTQAALAMENKRLAVPAGVESLPTSAMQEDHVSNGWAAGRKLRLAVANLRRVLAVELLCAAAALEFRAPLAPAPATGAALERLREVVPSPAEDRWLSPQLQSVEELLLNGSMLQAVEEALGEPID